MFFRPTQEVSRDFAEVAARRLRAFGPLPGEDEALLTRHCLTHQVYPRNVDIVSYGRKPQHTYVILAGMACRYKVLPDGSRQILAFLVPGDMTDYEAAEQRELDHGIATLCQARVATLKEEQLAELLARPAIARTMLAASLTDLAILREWLVMNGRRRALTSTAHLLIELYLRHSVVGLTDGNRFRLSLTQKDLADAAGMTHIHMNRNLRSLKEMGLIAIEDGTMCILKPMELASVGEFEADYLSRLLPSSSLLDSIDAA